MEAYDGSAKVSIDNKGNVSITTPTNPLLLGAYALAPFAITRIANLFRPGLNIWPAAPANGSGVVLNGLRYTHHALERMAPAFNGGRGVPPSVVAHAIQNGTKVAGSTPGTIIHTFENVRVVTDTASKVVITVIKTAH